MSANGGMMPVICRSNNPEIISKVIASPDHYLASWESPKVWLGDIIDVKVGIWSIGDIFLVFGGYGLGIAYACVLIKTALLS